MKGYTRKYEVISTEELSKKIVSATKPFYYLIYIKSSTDKYINVVNASTGEIIYSQYKPLSYNLKASDIKDLNKLIK